MKFNKIDPLPHFPPYGSDLMISLGLKGLHCGSGANLKSACLNTDSMTLEDQRGHTSQVEKSAWWMILCSICNTMPPSHSQSAIRHLIGFTPNTSLSTSHSQLLWRGLKKCGAYCFQMESCASAHQIWRNTFTDI